MLKTIKDSINCFLSFTNQYKKNKTFIKISNATPKLKTDKAENVLGGKKGSMKDNSKRTANILLINHSNLSIKLNFFMLFTSSKKEIFFFGG